MRKVPVSTQKWPICFNRKFFERNINITFMCLLAFFNVQNLKNTFRVKPELWGCTIILGSKCPIYPIQVFFGKTINLSFMYLLYFSIVLNLKKNRMDPELWNHIMFGPKMAHLPRMIFFMENYYHNFHVPFRPFHYAKF